jgi:hypothetical protein
VGEVRETAAWRQSAWQAEYSRFNQQQNALLEARHAASGDTVPAK